MDPLMPITPPLAIPNNGHLDWSVSWPLMRRQNIPHSLLSNSLATRNLRRTTSLAVMVTLAMVWNTGKLKLRQHVWRVKLASCPDKPVASMVWMAMVNSSFVSRTSQWPLSKPVWLRPMVHNTVAHVWSSFPTRNGTSSTWHRRPSLVLAPPPPKVSARWAQQAFIVTGLCII